MCSVSKFPLITRIKINSLQETDFSGIISPEPEAPDFKIKDGAIELFENMFGNKV
jgi:hypothetical protein